MLNIHAHKDEWSADLETVYSFTPETFEYQYGIFKTAGIHPWYIQEDWKQQLLILEQLCVSKAIIGIGECGLDRFRGPKLDFQKTVFEAQIQLAETFDLPVIIHAVKTYADLAFYLKKYQNKVRFVLHGYSGSKEQTEQLLALNAWFSFGKALVDKSELQQIFATLPADKIFLETDTAPRSLLLELYKLAASIRGLEVETFKSMQLRNFTLCFKQTYE